jgi:hypothetical protein
LGKSDGEMVGLGRELVAAEWCVKSCTLRLLCRGRRRIRSDRGDDPRAGRGGPDARGLGRADGNHPVGCGSAGGWARVADGGDAKALREGGGEAVEGGDGVGRGVPRRRSRGTPRPTSGAPQRTPGSYRISCRN